MDGADATLKDRIRPSTGSVSAEHRTHYMCEKEANRTEV